MIIESKVGVIIFALPIFKMENGLPLETKRCSSSQDYFDKVWFARSLVTWLEAPKSKSQGE